MLNRVKKAVKSFRRAIELAPDDAEVYWHLGYSYCSLKEYVQGVEFLKRAVQLNPDYADAYIWLANCYNSLGQYHDGMQALKEALRIQPDRSEAHYNLGELYLVLGDTSSALKEHEILKGLDETLADLLLNLIGKGKLDRVFDGQETEEMKKKLTSGQNR